LLIYYISLLITLLLFLFMLLLSLESIVIRMMIDRRTQYDRISQQQLSIL